MFLVSKVYLEPADNNVDEYMAQFDETVTSILDIIAPVKKIVQRKSKKSTFWLSDEAVEAKRKRRRRENTWLRTRSEEDRIQYKLSCRQANKLILESRQKHYAKQVSDSSGCIRSLWKTVNGILHPNTGNQIPDIVSNKSAFSALADFFLEKVAVTIGNIRSKIGALNISRAMDTLYEGASLMEVNPVTYSEVKKLISSMASKNSPLDILPTSILKSCAAAVTPFIVNLANLSFKTGVFPSRFKTAQVTPILKKQGLDASIPANYRPISNLHTISKILERLYLARLRPYVFSW
jgi:hypothetical protein